MAKVGLKDTLTLLAKGYTKKDIDALAEIDEQNEAQQEVPAPIITESVPAAELTPAEGEKEKKIDPEMVKQMEELQAKLKESEEKLKKLQKENINKDSAPAAAEAKQKETDSLLNLVRGFM
jgi:DNA-binding transcriptional MerR regulator